MTKEEIEQKREEQRRRRAATCKHFTGYQNEVCDVGINYRNLVGGPDLGWAARLPCIPDSPLRKQPTASCKDISPRGMDAVIAEEVKHKAHMEKMSEAFRLIRANGEQRGIVECPKCRGQLHFSVAAINGHIWGRCETDGCLAWMQ